MNKTKIKTMEEIVEAVDVDLEPFSYVRKKIAIVCRQFIEDLIEFIEKDLEILAKALENEPPDLGGGGYNKPDPPIKFIIHLPHGPHSSLRQWASLTLPPEDSLTLTPEDELCTTITSSIAFAKDYLKEEYSKSLKNLLADLLADLDSKSFRLFIEKPDIFMSKPSLLSIEVSATMVKVRLGMYALDYCQYCDNLPAGSLRPNFSFGKYVKKEHEQSLVVHGKTNKIYKYNLKEQEEEYEQDKE